MKHPDKEQEKQHPAEEKPKETHGIVQPMIDGLNPKPQVVDDEQGPPRGPLHPPQPAELDQDAGSGYNPDGTFPQP